MKSAGAYASSVDDLLESGLHSSSLQGILDAASAIPNDYLAGEDYKARLAARETLGRAITTVMDANRLDAIVYPTVRRIAPLVGGGQAGSNAALSANTGFPAISVPAGFTSGGFPVGVELLGRSFAEPTLLGLAFDYEQATHHRRPPVLDAGSTLETAQPGSVRAEVTATGARSVPPSSVPFQATARFSFADQTRELDYEIRLSGTLGEVAGVYLHRRANRQNGGVAYILAKTAAPQIAGRVTVTTAEAADLKAGKCYVAVTSTKSPRLGARADIVFS